MWNLGDVRGVDGWVRRNGSHRTPPGRERSNGKVYLSCAADRLARATCVVSVRNVPLDGRCTINPFARPRTQLRGRVISFYAVHSRRLSPPIDGTSAAKTGYKYRVCLLMRQLFMYVVAKAATGL